MPGQLRFVGRYEVYEELGRGGMGVVYRGRDPTIGRIVAIKTIHLATLSEPQERRWLSERLLREARAAGVLSHPNIVTIYDVVEQEELAGIVMEFVNGPTLARVLSGVDVLDNETILRVLWQTAVALDYAHGNGIIHRDIKPGNIMIHHDRSVKITDFGIARIASTQPLTGSGRVLGTPHYMAPEQMQKGGRVDGKTDQFSLAVLAYEMLAGEKPFVSDNLPRLFYQIFYEDPAPVQELNPTVSGEVDRVLRRALAKEAAERYATCTEFVEALEAACKASGDWRALPQKLGPAVQSEHQGGLASDSIFTPFPSQPMAVERAPAKEEAPAPEPRRVAPAVVVIAIVVVLAAACLLWAWHLRSSRPSAPAEVAARPPAQVAAPPPPASAPKPAHVIPKVAVQPQPRPAKAPPPALRQPVARSGRLMWAGQLAPNAVLRIDGNNASTGQVFSPLPGIPVKVEVQEKGLKVIEPPGAGNGWRRVVIQNGNEPVNSIRIKWTEVREPLILPPRAPRERD